MPKEEGGEPPPAPEPYGFSKRGCPPVAAFNGSALAGQCWVALARLPFGMSFTASASSDIPGLVGRARHHIQPSSLGWRVPEHRRVGMTALARPRPCSGALLRTSSAEASPRLTSKPSAAMARPMRSSRRSQSPSRGCTAWSRESPARSARCQVGGHRASRRRSLDRHPVRGQLDDLRLQRALGMGLVELPRCAR